MHSTGEVACFGRDIYEAFVLSLMAAGFKLPTPTSSSSSSTTRKALTDGESKGKGDGKSILVSVGSTTDKARFLESASTLVKLGYRLMATPGTAEFLASNDIG